MYAHLDMYFWVILYFVYLVSVCLLISACYFCLLLLEMVNKDNYIIIIIIITVSPLNYVDARHSHFLVAGRSGEVWRQLPR